MVGRDKNRHGILDLYCLILSSQSMELYIVVIDIIS